ncbi:MAG: glutamate synthase large subunit [Chloroflexota bacterium]|nr:MAG: glutamate synthase large subunit [Chloroflexota bacterium]
MRLHRPAGAERTLYDARFEHDACGVGFVARADGRPTHEIVRQGIDSVINLTHRGAVSADARSGDGAGILTQIPRRLLAEDLAARGIRKFDADRMAVGMFFMPRSSIDTERMKSIVTGACERRGFTVVAWRDVPVDPTVLGEKALVTQPTVVQLIVVPPITLDARAIDRDLLLIRKESERQAEAADITDFYVPSFSCRTIVYKGLFVAPQLGGFYRDLEDPRFESALAVFHQRYSTNTFPNWQLSQPFRSLAHNGEINTLQGNRNWVRARTGAMRSTAWGDRIAELAPIIWEEGSDTASLDETVELLELSGRDVLHSMMMLVPEAWENMPHMVPAWRSFYEYHASLTEPWDGPGSFAFSDGTVAGASLDRNGLRPARYKVTADGVVIVASEVGTIDIPESEVVEKGRLGPGQMIAVDTARHLILHNDRIKDEVAGRKPYGEWARRYWRLGEHVTPRLPIGSLNGTTKPLQHAFGYTNEEVKFVLEPMGVDGKEAIWSMGDDAPLAILSRKNRVLYHYFRQRFAQVTNPPIDPLREAIVMSLDAYLGRRGSLLEETPEHADLIHIKHPLLVAEELDAIRSVGAPHRTASLSALFDPRAGTDGLDRALTDLVEHAIAEVEAGATILVVSDRGVDAAHAPVPMILAVGAVHHGLIRANRRSAADIIAETGDAWDVHQIACLIGYGASAVHPYLAIESIVRLAEELTVENLDPTRALRNMRTAVSDGLLKILSKMGISTLTSYRGAQIFEAIGLGDDVIDRCFAGTPSRIGGMGLKEIASDTVQRHAEAFGLPAGDLKLHDPGFYRFRRDGEYHDYNPRVVRALQKAADTGGAADYRAFADMVNGRDPAALRDLMRVATGRAPISIDVVEPVESIRRRFTTQAMSLGALSPEAHSTISIAMNRIGGRSNTGEGGEDPVWYRRRGDGDSADNKTKQIASGRFGVTTEYLAHAFEIEIKMAQGSKPGEGGQLPGHKVSELIARLRHSVPGIPLISPPPHHDIYSIEDLAQLIHDLKTVNPRARIGVKLVAESGVGTIAAGVAKAYADYVLISGHAGGTGASPLSSIKGAGCPWELGLAETQQVLVLNDLRGRIRVRTDGGLKTGRDVIVAALLGAEEYGFGTGAVVSIGCDMARACHLNTCPTGIATQREDLRAKFTGRPEQLINYLTGIAQEARELLAAMGCRSLDEIIGRSDFINQNRETSNPRANMLDLTRLIAPPDPEFKRPIRSAVDRNDRGEIPLDDSILPELAAAIERSEPCSVARMVRNRHRTVGTKIAGEIAYRHGSEGLPDATVELCFEGTAGQSFAAFTTRGMRIVLHGEANDYVGKGMSGGEIIVRPPDAARYDWHENTIIGNTVLYGATGGALYAAGRVGERFCVRNSGALAVAEGAGDHCCEYMTAGITVILGETGRNFGAGMSNGIAFVLDEEDQFPRRYNPDMVGIERVTNEDDAEVLRTIVNRHREETCSPRAAAILAEWERYLPMFWKVVPHPSKGKQQTTVLAVRASQRAAPRA